MSEPRRAPGHPGAGPHWESARKTGVGRACNFRSRVWFTLGEGILNEVYFPGPDTPSTKNCGFIITDGHEFFSDERVDTTSDVQWAAPQAPAYTLINTHRGGRYRIRKQIIAHPDRDSILQRVTFEGLDNKAYRLFYLVTPHLGDEGIHNTASLGDYKGAPLLLAQSCESALAVSCSTAWKDRSVGYVGKSDGWLDLSQNKELKWHYDSAEDGNVALVGEIHCAPESFVASLGFGRSSADASYQAIASLAEDFDTLWNRYIDEWADWQRSLRPIKGTEPSAIFWQSTVVLRTHEAVEQPGARVASLSVPWGEVQAQECAAGYHAVWARDCAQSALGLLACGAEADVRRTLDYLSVVQEADGHWPQLMWADGDQFWSGIQIDSIAAPILLYEIARQEGVIFEEHARARYALMVRKAAAYICRNGPITQQDRWERNGGFSPYTLAMAIAGLLIASRAAQEMGWKDFASCFEETADAWNSQIENWTYCADSAVAKNLGLKGTYCRIVPADRDGRPLFKGGVNLENSMLKKKAAADEMVSPDVWALVRLGLRSPFDPRIVETTAAIDALLRTNTPRGPVWHRYNNDGYGEKKDGSPFCKEGVGRAWPLLSGERAHYEVARGDLERARDLVASLAKFSSDVFLLPEQVWDTDDIPRKQLHLGHATGSARPLAWAHSEYLQSLRSLADECVFGCPKIVARRYVEMKTAPRHTIWRRALQTPRLIPGAILRIEDDEPFFAFWSEPNGTEPIESSLSPVRLHFADLSTQNFNSGEINFKIKRRSGEETRFVISL
jgi:glucoamylase